MPFDATLAAFRFGYGLPTPTGTPGSVDAMLAALTAPDRAMADWPIPNGPTVVALDRQMHKARLERGAGPAAERAFRQARTAVAVQAHAVTLAQFTRALANPDGFHERLVVFWANHFTAARRDPLARYEALAMRDQAIRPHLTGSFADLLTAAILHPALLHALDQPQSIGPTSKRGRQTGRGLNENLAREVMELHSLGVGAGYDQTDVTQLAELLTGLTVTRDRETGFEPNRAEPGAETVLGTRYDGAGLDPIRAVLGDLARHPATARHIARKLAVHFVADEPDAGLVATLEAAFNDTGGNLTAVCRALLTHPAAWATDAQKARQPFDFVVAALRALDVGPQQVARMANGAFRRMILDPLTGMGQPFNLAPGPDGWAEEAEAWITPQGLAARIA